jgi:hypothetical protein
MKGKILAAIRAALSQGGQTQISDKTLGAYVELVAAYITAAHITDENGIAKAIVPHVAVLREVQANINSVAAQAVKAKEAELAGKLTPPDTEELKYKKVNLQETEGKLTAPDTEELKYRRVNLQEAAGKGNLHEAAGKLTPPDTEELKYRRVNLQEAAGKRNLQEAAGKLTPPDTEELKYKRVNMEKVIAELREAVAGQQATLNSILAERTQGSLSHRVTSTLKEKNIPDWFSSPALEGRTFRDEAEATAFSQTLAAKWDAAKQDLANQGFKETVPPQTGAGAVENDSTGIAKLIDDGTKAIAPVTGTRNGWFTDGHAPAPVTGGLLRGAISKSVMAQK